MLHPEKLEPLLIQTVQAQPNGSTSYLVRDISRGTTLGDISRGTTLGVIHVSDDHLFEVRHDDGRFAGIHRILADAMQSLANG